MGLGFLFLEMSWRYMHLNKAVLLNSFGNIEWFFIPKDEKIAQ